MIDPTEKSTEVPVTPPAEAAVGSGVVLDGRLGLYHEAERWLAVADLHFGYEVSRRAAGGLFPMWGMETVTERLRDLVASRKPRTLILAGDIVDSSAAPQEAVRWLEEIGEFCENLVLIEGNHDRGAVKRHLPFVPWFEIGEFFFHHGHRDFFPKERAGDLIEATGHIHPSVSFNDGAGTSLKLPSLMTETREDGSRHWTLPAFSPWAGGCKLEPSCEGSICRQWACSRQRVFEVPV